MTGWGPYQDKYVKCDSFFRSVYIFVKLILFYSRYVHVLNEFTPERQLCDIADISYGKENIAVSCVNSIDNTYPEYVEYSTVR